MANLAAKVGVLLKNLLVEATPKMKVAAAYARVELAPPSLRDLPAVKTGIQSLINSAKSGRYRDLTVKEAALNTLVAIEVYCWFYIGECIGKRHLVGYDV